MNTLHMKQVNNEENETKRKQDVSIVFHYAMKAQKIDGRIKETICHGSNKFWNPDECLGNQVKDR